MKFLDRFLRDWRIKKAERYIKPYDRVLDIGAFDITFFERLSQKPIDFGVGLDPLLKDAVITSRYQLISGKFPQDLPQEEAFDCITMLAVLEHIPSQEQSMLNEKFYDCLEPNGRIIITVPSPFVDKILWVLSKLRLIDGMSLDEHYGFKAKETPKLFNSEQFRLLKHEPFQLGLNNLFVFEKIG
ncbi:class I SAM-dependent methyltransferase [Winogradskyella poriferorum]|uniref:class I SAM-dependent methyltransferase n=1 Tax=Winogradskyella poriferorum TaxID=307627 RepID=UPI003D65B51A